MIHRAVTKMLVIATVTAATLAAFAAPSMAHFGQYSATSKFGSRGSGAGQFNTPIGVAIDEGTGDVYAVDEGDNRVERFHANGEYVSEFDGHETPAKTFASPAGIAVDNSGGPSKGHVYVADPIQNVVDVFDSSGKYLFQIEVAGLLALATDTDGHLWVWTQQTSFEEYGETGALILRQPIARGATSGIVVDSSGDVYVLYGSEKIGRYSPPSFIENNEAGLNEARALAINPVTNSIFQHDGSGIVVWPPFGGPNLWEQPEESFSGALTNSYGLAVNGKTGALYASDESADDIEVFNGVVTPDAITGGASKITIDSATIEGAVNPGKTKTTYFFEWGETSSFGNSTILEEAGEGGVNIPVSAELAGLEPHSVYHYRVVASNENGTSHGPKGTFTTLPVPPVLEGAPAASDPSRSSVVLHATINPKHSNTAFRFAYVEEAAYEPSATDPYGAGGATALSSIGSGSGGQSAEQLLAGLKPNTTYHYTIVASNQAGRVIGTDATFTTGAFTLPVVATGASSGVAQNGATIAGVVDTSGLPTTYGFEVGTSTNYGPATGLGSVGAGLSEAPVSLSLTGLLPSTTYHYRLTATNVDGTSYGIDQTFTTSAFANTFAVPPAPLPFVEVPAIAFPSEPKPVAVKKKGTGTKKSKKLKKRSKAKGKKQSKNKKK